MLPLEGLTVVSIEHAIAAPLASRHLAELGARVIKIERPGSGDFARAYDDTVQGMSSHFVWANRSKELLTVDLKAPEGMQVLRRLLAKADVFIHNLSRGALARLGLEAEGLGADFPRLVQCSISGFRADGPHAERKAYDLLIQAEAGLLSVTGLGETPAKVGIPVADIAAGLYAYSSILAALTARERSGQAQVIEVSMFDALVEWMGFPFYYTVYGGRQLGRTGAHHAAIAPYGPVRCADGDVLLAVQNDREWKRFSDEVLGAPELVAHPKFSTNRARVENRGALDDLLSAALGSLSVKEATARLDRAGIGYARMRTIDEVAADGDLLPAARWVDTGSPAGIVGTLKPPVSMSGTSYALGPIPGLGEHSDAILAELGYTERAIADMRSRNVT